MKHQYSYRAWLALVGTVLLSTVFLAGCQDPTSDVMGDPVIDAPEDDSQQNNDNSNSSPPPPPPPPPPTCQTLTLSGGTVGALCPVHKGGDKEFAGNGPNVKAWARVDWNSSKTKLYVTTYLWAQETKSDWTTAEGSMQTPVYNAPSGWRIASVLSDGFSQVQYIDTDHAYDYPYITHGNLASQFRIKGDTGGNDVGNCTTDDVHMYVTINPIKIKICKN